MYSAYGYFAGTEIWNHERLVSYMVGNVALGYKGLKGPNTSVNPNCFCGNAHCLYCDQGAGENGSYTTPALDQAPWYDPDEPGSTEFAGLFVEDITGFDGTVARDTTDGAISGTSLGPLRLKGRCLTVTGWLRAKTCCGAEYGLRWLQEALLGNNFCNNCSLSDLYMLKCCPPDDDTCHIEEVSETKFATAGETGMGVSVTDNGGGQYTIILIDPEPPTNSISLESGALGNFDGYIPTAFNNDQTWRLALTSLVGSNATDIFTVPWITTTNFTTGLFFGIYPSVAVDVNINTTSDCEDEQAQIDSLTTALANFVITYGSAFLEPMWPVGVGITSEVVEGINPTDYIRLMHKVGLTDGVKVIDRQGTCCSTCGCTNLKVQFTLCSELPYIYSDITWCTQDQPFPDDEYCLNLKQLCGQCGSPSTGTKSYVRQVARPQCGIKIRHDGTWCSDGSWDPDTACPPTDCLLTVAEAVAFDPANDSGCADGSSSNTCLIALQPDFSWAEHGGWDIADGWPPKYCKLEIYGSGVCDGSTTPPQEPCLIKVTYNKCTGVKTWDPIRWNGHFPVSDECFCVAVAETCTITCNDCANAHECPITVNCDGTWDPIDWVFDETAVFPDPNCTYTIPGQDTTPLNETVEIPADVFVPDCGPLPISPPAPFLLTTNCFCDPWVTRRMCCTFTNPGDWNDATSYLEIYTGSSEMRHLKIEAYQNPFGEAVPCPCDPNDPFWECRSPCTSIAVPQLPASSKLIIDSRLHTAQLVLANGSTVSAMRYIFSEDGAPFGWFDISQCATFCIVASVDAASVADDATISLGMVTRYLASGW